MIWSALSTKPGVSQLMPAGRMPQPRFLYSELNGLEAHETETVGVPKAASIYYLVLHGIITDRCAKHAAIA